MHTFSKTINVSTNAQQTFIDITHTLRDIVQESGVQTGTMHLFVPHTTAAVTINENADPDVVKDMLLGLDKAFPDRKEFAHMEGNSHAHLKSSCIGADQTVLIEKNTLVLGTWQGIYFCEFDGPRTRKLIVRIQGND